ncbi:Protein of unknown function (DUF2789) [Methylophaga frappieri]|uniref:DUF2789 domain-containing protein n=1 Tax=Methylophaga frappieri (strain ATCC BAA-2434 / DSM 25690 / JAM7) TaxID=754477 RepID=I1YL77_METFJ|nr:DUF2789 domain-containing protein [Methylophaga frappieri]AFJ03670.1 Protein of unknown function (DUF2789) [Methylophaga frappieri]
METQFHTMENLFLQLGLKNDAYAIRRFIEIHRLQDDENIEDALFWSPNQAAFLRECLTADSDWAEVVDQLSAQLRV